MKDYYVYIHLRGDNHQPFYVGKGCGRRATDRSNRNRWWNNVAGAVGYEVKFLAKGLSNMQALNAEKLAIAALRKSYNLVNIQDGGDQPPIMFGDQHPAFGKPAHNRDKPNVGVSRALRGRKQSATHIANRVAARDHAAHSATMTGRKWYNNGIICVMKRECPEGFKPGRIAK